MSFEHFLRFTSDASGLEKILRLSQSLCQILAAFSFTLEDGMFWRGLRGRFALGRRYFRFFKFLPCFNKAYELFCAGGAGRADGKLGIMDWLEIGKWGFMGGYLGLESATFLDAVGLKPAAWAGDCMLEANRLWFYSLLCSILLGSGLLLGFGPKYLPKSSSPDRKGRTSFGRSRGRRVKLELQREATKHNWAVIKMRLVTDAFDLLIPGYVTGWIPTSFGAVGGASVVSTLLGAVEVWDRLQ